MTDSQSVDGEARHETHLERLDRNLEEMTGELRVVVTGVQVLFAFLLIVPFNAGFAHVGNFERTVYFITLILAALASPAAARSTRMSIATPRTARGARSHRQRRRARQSRVANAVRARSSSAIRGGSPYRSCRRG